MKKIILFLLSLWSYYAMAQNTFPAPSGNVGIGTLNPSTGLQLGNLGNDVEAKQIYIPGTYNFEGMRLGQLGNGNSALEMVNHVGLNDSYGVRIMANIDNGGPGLQFQYATYQPNYAALDYHTGIFMATSGSVGIGTMSPREKLSVNGNIRAKEIKVETANWPDYVFEEGYKVGTLEELESYIRENKHLPEMPSAKDVQANGIELGEMNKLLLKKIEELTLHLIEKDKEMKKYELDKNLEKNKNNVLSAKLEELLKRVETLEKTDDK